MVSDDLPPERPGRLTGEAAGVLNERTARLSVATATALGVIKLTAALLTGSLSIVASLVDSVMDLVSSSVNYVAIRFSRRPADAGHAYGHGKVEGLAGLAQAVLVAASGIFLLVEGIRRAVTGATIGLTDVGIGVMAVSTVASIWITWKLKHTAKRTASVALAADAVHYQSDIWTNLGVLAALLVIRITGLSWVDGAVAALVSLVVIATAIHVLLRSTDELMDKSLPEAEEKELLRAIQKAVPAIRGLHDVRTRKAGPQVFMDCHAQFDRGLSFVEAHRYSEQVRMAIERVRPGALVNVHADPHPLLASDLDVDEPDTEIDPVTFQPL
jgi:ferrous-iron efflux pump FieF